MAQLDQLTAILNNLTTELANETAYRAVNGPKPSYTVQGKTVQWNDYLKTMTEEIASLRQLVQQEDIFELPMRGY